MNWSVSNPDCASTIPAARWERGDTGGQERDQDAAGSHELDHLIEVITRITAGDVVDPEVIRRVMARRRDYWPT